MFNDIMNYEYQKYLEKKELEEKKETVSPIIFKQYWLYPFPYRFLFTLAKYNNTWKWPFLGFKEQKNKTFFIVGGGKYYIAMRLWNIRKSVMQEGMV